MKIADRRRIYGKVEEPLPYDYEVEWLGSNGNVNVPTNFTPNTYDLYINGKIYYNGYVDTTSYVSWYSAYTNEQSSTYRVLRSASDNTKVLIYNGRVAGGGGISVNVSIGSIYTFEFTPTTLKWNGTSYSFEHSGNVNTGKLSLFSGKFKGRFYYFQIKKGDEMLFDLIPVVKDGVGCFYNKVNGDFLYNTGSGSLEAGPRK